MKFILTPFSFCFFLHRVLCTIDLSPCTTPDELCASTDTPDCLHCTWIWMIAPLPQPSCTWMRFNIQLLLYLSVFLYCVYNRYLKQWNSDNIGMTIILCSCIFNNCIRIFTLRHVLCIHVAYIRSFILIDLYFIWFIVILSWDWCYNLIIILYSDYCFLYPIITKHCVILHLNTTSLVCWLLAE